ncbi:cation:proton antiporter [Aromatoleum petrolei]|uniref:Potassium transporter n=1 Tax=Aromatoleum petrolei TaxID=76116 RepID=A0ABX1MSZ6_9RHOO|nr:cation:proton antiporter [Aromatoleum petrolei]NMF91102.1 potassium transporter [Aromatoleum petrolei]QTQ36334.1 Putative potassium transporter [Aromatoleum petrolei]
MDAHDAPAFLREVILFLAFAGVLIPLLQRRRINPVLGFLAVGMMVGPFGLGQHTDAVPWLRHLTFSRQEDVSIFAEFGVIFLMFMIGLEMSVDRLWAMRRLVFGLGALQVGLSALTIGGIAYAFGNTFESSVVLGFVLSFSSTAVVMQLLTQRREVGTPLGQATFSVLLFQDLAVVPLLVVVSVLGQKSGESVSTLMGVAALKGIVTVALIYFIGSRIVRPLFHQIAAIRQSESFMAVTLLTTLGVAVLTQAAGLSMEMGALLAGLLIAETEFRHEVEVTIEPFKGLLMGLFFMSVGMGIDVSAILAEPMLLPLSVIGVLAIKGLILIVLFRLFGLSWGRAAEGGIMLGQGGEFAFIVIGMALGLGLINPTVGHFMLLVVGLSMLVTPPLTFFGRKLGDGIDAKLGGTAPEASAPLDQISGHVIVAGYGRVGQLIGELLSEQGIPHLAVESDAKRVKKLRARGAPVHFGDASRPELLRKLHLERAVAVVLTMDHTAAAVHAVKGIRASSPGIRIAARARDEAHAQALRDAGATVVIPETLESGLQLAGSVFETLGVPGDVAARLLEQERARRIAVFRPS